MFTSSYPFVGLSPQVVEDYMATTKRPHIDELFDYAISNGLIEEDIEL